MNGKLPILRIGSRGENVRTVQHLLRHHGLSLAVDRIFGPQTEQRVREF